MVLPVRRRRAARRVGGGARAAGLAAVAFVGCFALLHTWFWSHHQLPDTPLYEGYGLALRHGLLPYRDIPVEYPPGALAAFVAPTYVDGYRETFGWLMAACGAGCVLLAALAGAGRAALAFLAVSPLLVGSLLLSRFDLWPELFVVAALACLVRDRHRLGYAALAAAVVTKGYGIVLGPLALVWTLRRRGGRETVTALACGLAAAAAVVLPFAALAPDGLWRSLRGELQRPLQVESLAGAAVMAFGHPHVVSTHGSLNLAGEGPLAAATSAAELAVLAACWVAFARGPADAARLLRFAAAGVAAAVALGKVLSPQFLVWLVPLVPLVRGRRGAAAAAILAAALVMTQAYFPARYDGYVYHRHLAWLVLARDCSLVALLAALSLPARARARSA